MKFREWITHNGDLFWEFGDISKMDTSHLSFDELPSDGDDFDEDDAYRDCESDLDFDDSEYFSDIYEDPTDDPNFDAQTSDDWVEDNPKPDEDDEQFWTPHTRHPLPMAGEEEEDRDERGTFNKEAFDEALEKWKEEYRQAQDDYETAEQDWYADMKRKRRQAEREAEQARDDAVRDCVEEKRSDHEEDRRNSGENGGYETSFQHDGNNYSVNFERDKSQDYQGVEVPGFFSIVFTGPKGTSSTKMAGTAATAIYTQLMLAVKKLIEIEQVNGLGFSPAEPGMGLVYQRFYRQYLQPGGFIRVDPYTYILKEWIKKNIKNSYNLKNAYSTILKTNREVLKKIKEVEADKAQMREFRRLNKMAGQVISFAQPNGGTSWPAIYLIGTDESRYDGPQLHGFVYDSTGPHKQTWKAISLKGQKLQEPQPQEAYKLVMQIYNHRNDQLIQNYIKPGLEALLEKYGGHIEKLLTPPSGKPAIQQPVQQPAQEVPANVAQPNNRQKPPPA